MGCGLLRGGLLAREDVVDFVFGPALAGDALQFVGDGLAGRLEVGECCGDGVGVAQGVGQILMEDIHFDKDGQLVTGSFMDYAMPRADILTPVEVKSNPVPTKTNPLGVKGAGEAGCVGAMPAVANAIVDALSHLGVRHIEMPATPERVWRTIREANGGQTV